MKRIGKYVKMICEELEGANCYAEKYIEYKADGKNEWAEKFKDMASDELKHADVIHEIAIDEIEKINRVFNPPADMQEKWEKAHIDYVNKAAWVKQMLAM